MTKYEKIKVMSINEMAKLLTRIMPDDCEYCMLQKDHDEQETYCGECIKQWLGSEEE